MYSLERRFDTRDLFHALRAAVPIGLLCLAGCGGYGSGAGSAAPPPTIAFDVQPSQVRLGEHAQLSWTVTAGATCAATGGWSGAQPATGTQQVSPTAVGSVSFTLTCRVPAGGAYGSGSAEAAKSVTLTVASANVYTDTPLAADTASALVLDARLVNPWGVAIGANSTVWVANARTDVATLYDGNGRAQPAANPRTVALPVAAGGAKFDPTGVVANGSADFVVRNATVSGPAKFIFVGKRGSMAGWSPGVDATNALNVYDDPAAVYTGLAMAKDGGSNFLYAADFHNARVDVFDASFARQASSAAHFGFVDPTLPAGYAPFGIQALNTGAGGAAQLYVTYAKQAAPDNRDSVSGAGLGAVDVYDTGGQLLKQLIVPGGALDAPWGVALAPADFGSLSGRLLVSNFGDGRINGFGASTGQFGAALSDSHGIPVSVPGVRGIAFGNDVNNQPHNTLFYAAGTNHEANGTFGRFDVGATPPILNQPPIAAISAPATGPVSAVVAVTATVQSSLAVARVEFFVGATSLGVVASAPFTLQWDTSTAANGVVLLTAKATDVDGNVGVSAALPVTVANGAAAATLTQLQAQVFTPICSGCHNGSNPPTGALPGAQNLSAGNAFANLVNVSSREVAGLLRVKPGDPANSYLIQKLEGGAGIQGARMPLGGPFLDAATIDRVKSWIAGNAPNN